MKRTTKIILALSGVVFLLGATNWGTGTFKQILIDSDNNDSYATLTETKVNNMVTGGSSSADGSIAVYDSTTGKVLRYISNGPKIGTLGEIQGNAVGGNLNIATGNTANNNVMRFDLYGLTAKFLVYDPTNGVNLAEIPNTGGFKIYEPNGSNSIYGQFNASALGAYSYALPPASGTMALTSDIPTVTSGITISFSPGDECSWIFSNGVLQSISGASCPFLFVEVDGKRIKQGEIIKHKTPKANEGTTILPLQIKTNQVWIVESDPERSWLDEIKIVYEISKPDASMPIYSTQGPTDISPGWDLSALQTKGDNNYLQTKQGDEFWLKFPAIPPSTVSVSIISSGYYIPLSEVEQIK